MVAFSPSLKKSVYFPLTCLFAASQSLSVPLARVTHLFCLKVNVGQSSLIAKEWIYCKKKEGRKRRRKGKKATFQWQLDTRLLKSLSVFCQPAAKPLRFLRPETMEHLKSEEGRKWPPPHFNMLPRSSDAACCVFFSVFSCLNMCVCADGLLRPTVVMTSKSAGLSVRCTLPRVRLWGGACIVSRKDREKKSSITRRLYLQSNFIPPAMRGGLSSEPCLAFKCGKSAQSPPLTRNAARLSSWCSLNKLNNEGISEMPKRHYTPTIRARSE